MQHGEYPHSGIQYSDTHTHGVFSPLSVIHPEANEIIQVRRRTVVMELLGERFERDTCKISTHPGVKQFQEKGIREYVSVKKHSCVYAHPCAHACTYARAHARTHTRFPGPAGVLISPRGRVSVDPKTLCLREVWNSLSPRL